MDIAAIGATGSLGRLLVARLAGKSPRVVRELPYLGRAIARGGLIPAEADTDTVTLDDWLAATS